MKKGHLLLSLLLIVSIIASNCSKGPIGPQGETGGLGPKGDTGTVGPQGPKGDSGVNGSKGDTGVNGADGADGAIGPQGPKGTANVIYSNWFPDSDIEIPWADSLFTVTSDSISRAIKIVPDITAGILDSGLVLCYVRHYSILTTQLLPYYFDGLELNYGLLPGALLLFFRNPTTHYAYQNYMPSDVEYRYIIIPGGVLASGRSQSPKTMSYEELCRTYNIPK